MSLSITTTTLPGASDGIGYSATLVATGGTTGEVVGPGSTTLGWTSSASGDFSLALLEVLPVIVPLPPSLKSLRVQAVKRAASY
jgi:hypothetical protein